MLGSSAKSRNVAGSFKTTASIGSTKGMTKTVIGNQALIEGTSLKSSTIKPPG
jgi:hypothetical protein